MSESERLDTVFHALSDATRRAILHKLKEAPASVSDLAEPHRMSLAAVSKHIKILEAAGLVQKDREGRTIRCRIQLSSLEEANRTIQELQGFWDDRLDELERFLKDSRAGTGGNDT